MKQKNTEKMYSLLNESARESELKVGENPIYEFVIPDPNNIYARMGSLNLLPKMIFVYEENFYITSTVLKNPTMYIPFEKEMEDESLYEIKDGFVELVKEKGDTLKEFLSMNIGNPVYLSKDGLCEKIEKDSETYQKIKDLFNEANKHLFTELEPIEDDESDELVALMDFDFKPYRRK